MHSVNMKQVGTLKGKGWLEKLKIGNFYIQIETPRHSQSQEMKPDSECPGEW
jgi:hypothetical protein